MVGAILRATRWRIEIRCVPASSSQRISLVDISCADLIFVGHGSLLLELRLLSYKIICGNARLYDKYEPPAEGKRAFAD